MRLVVLIALLTGCELSHAKHLPLDANVCECDAPWSCPIDRPTGACENLSQQCTYGSATTCTCARDGWICAP